MSAHERVLEALRAHGCRSTGGGKSWTCPAHEDRKPSLAVTYRNGRVLLHCHAGCRPEDVVDALGFTMADLFEGERSKDRRRRPQIDWSRPNYVFEYRKADGEIAYEVGRFEFINEGGECDKTFRMRLPGGRWSDGIGGTPRVLYHWPEVILACRAGDPIWIHEGEKCADLFHERTGLVSTSAAGGAGGVEKHAASLAVHLAEAGARQVNLLVDRDEAGIRGCRAWGRELSARRIRVCAFQARVERPGADIVDHFDHGLGLEDLVEITEVLDAAESGADGRGTAILSSGLARFAERPIEFDDLRHGPPPPLEAFPDPLADLIREAARAVQVSEAFVAAGVLGIVASAAGRRVKVRVSDGHSETVGLFLGLVAGSGERKMVLRQLVEPLLELERELAEAARPTLGRRRAELEVLQRRIQELQKKASKQPTKEDRQRLIQEAVELEAEMPTEAFAPELVIDDATTEAVARVLSQQNGVAAVVSEEAGALVETWAGRYQAQARPAPNIDLVLKSYDGGFVRVRRITRDPIDLADPCLSITLAMQPIMLAKIAANTEFRGRGLVARFCFVCCESLVGKRRNQTEPIDPGLMSRYSRIIKTIGALPIAKPGEVPALRFSGPTWEAWNAYAQEVEISQADGGELEDLRDWGSKHPGRAARIAGLFHLVRYVDRERPWEVQVSEEDVLRGWAVAEWLTAHQRAAFDLMGLDESTQLARRILDWIRRDYVTAFSERDAFDKRRRRSGFGSKTADFDAALGKLIERGFIRPVDERRGRGAGRPPSRRFEVSPHAQNPQNPHNAESDGSRPDSADCAGSAVETQG